MKGKKNVINSGIQIYGGALTAENIAVGDRASLAASVNMKDSPAIGGDSLDWSKLTEELSALLDAMKNDAKSKAQCQAVNQIAAAHAAARPCGRIPKNIGQGVPESLFR